MTTLASPAVADESSGADVCLEIAAGAIEAPAWSAVVDAVAEAAAVRNALFPEPTLSDASTGADGASMRLDVMAGHADESTTPARASCLETGLEWGARFGRPFLEAGADQMLAEAPTTPGIDSSVDIEWYPDENRLQTTLVFAGPLDIPNGTCWIDDVLSIDTASAAAVASGGQGVKTSLFAEGACGRFFDHLPDGGAGGQAVTLLPTEVVLPDGQAIRFRTEMVRVTDDAVVVGGTVETR